MKKKRRTKRASYWGMGATTTAKHWGFWPIPGKGGKTTNHEIQESMIQREMREMHEKDKC